jgi:hypothetical protein
MARWVQKYVQGCHSCQTMKLPTTWLDRPLHPLEVPDDPWEVIAWDLIRPLLESRSFNTIVTMVDIQTKAIKLEPANVTISVANKATENEATEAKPTEAKPTKQQTTNEPRQPGLFLLRTM